MCLTGAASGVAVFDFVVATGLISSFPMIPSLHVLAPETLFAGPNAMPAVGPMPETGERYMTSTLLPVELPHTGAPGPISSLTRYIEPPAFGSPSIAYHWRSTAVSGTPVLLQVTVLPWSSERLTEKLTSVRSLK